MIIAFIFVVTLVLCDTFSPLHSQFSPSKPTNAVCQFDISKTGSYATIAEALQQPCAGSEGYEITLLDSEHTEHLTLNLGLPILIIGGNSVSNVWQVDLLNSEIIDLQQGKLTLDKIEFVFLTSVNSVSNISPGKYLIFVGNRDYLPSLAVQQCTFHSISWDSELDIFHIFVVNGTKIDINGCIFKGISSGQSQTSAININYCNEIILNNCSFQDLSSSSRQDTVQLTAYVDDGLVTVKDCEFVNNNTSLSKRVSLSIYGHRKYKLEIINNKFNNLRTDEYRVGALQIYDDTYKSDGNEIIVSDNIFNNNKGIQSGSFLLYSRNNYSTFNFNNNKFTSNENQQKDGQGKDAYLTIQNLPNNWKPKKLSGIIKDLFKGSITDSKKASVYYEASQPGKGKISGNIDLNKQTSGLSGGAIAGIVIGSLVAVAAVITTIVIIVIVYNKKKKQDSSGSVNKSLIDNSQGSYQQEKMSYE